MRSKGRAIRGVAVFLFLFLIWISLLMPAVGASEKELLRLIGTVDYRREAESTWNLIFATRPVAESDWTRTHEASLARLQFQNGKQIATLYERTVVQVQKVEPERTSLKQFLGRLRVSVKHFLGRGRPMEIQTPSAAVAIRGSSVDSVVLEDHTTFVTVGSGLATLTASGQSVDLLSGESAVVHPGGTPIFLGNSNTFQDASGQTYQSDIDAAKEVSELSTDPGGYIQALNLNSDQLAYEQRSGTSWGISPSGGPPPPPPSNSASTGTSTANTATASSQPQSLPVSTVSGTTSGGETVRGLFVGDSTSGAFFGSSADVVGFDGFGAGRVSGGTVNGVTVERIALSPPLEEGSTLKGTFSGSTFSITSTQFAPFCCPTGGTDILTATSAGRAGLFTLSDGFGKDVIGIAAGNLPLNGDFLAVVFDSSGFVGAVLEGNIMSGSIGSIHPLGADSGSGPVSISPGGSLSSSGAMSITVSPPGTLFTGSLQSSAPPTGIMLGTVTDPGGVTAPLSGFYAGDSVAGVFFFSSPPPLPGVGGGHVFSGTLKALVFTPSNPANNIEVIGTFTGSAASGSFSGSGTFLSSGSPAGSVSGQTFGIAGQIP